MYVVVSQWEPIRGHEEELKKIGSKLQEYLTQQPGVEFIKAFESDSGKVVVVSGYKDEAAYATNVVKTPIGQFMKALQDRGLEKHAHWLGSERGIVS
jgi:hypothetical protein